jgi:hypothetical protein
MNAIGNMITKFFDVLVLPFGNHHALALAVLSLLTGVAMAFVFKWTSNPKAIKAAKDKLKGRILEMKIYQDDPGIIIKAFGGTLVCNGIYLSKLLVPFLVLIIPVMIVFMQMDERYGRAPLSDNSHTILSVQLKDHLNPRTTEVDLTGDGGVVPDSRPVRVRESHEVDWRLRVDQPGTHELTVTAEGTSYQFPVVAGDDYRMIGHQRNASSFMEPLLHPGMPAIPADAPFSRIHLTYPSIRYTFLWWDAHWIVIFLIYSAVALKFVIKFEI